MHSFGIAGAMSFMWTALVAIGALVGGVCADEHNHVVSVNIIGGGWEDGNKIGRIFHDLKCVRYWGLVIVQLLIRKHAVGHPYHVSLNEFNMHLICILCYK